MTLERTALRWLTVATRTGVEDFLASLPMQFWYVCDELHGLNPRSSWYDLLCAMRDQRLEAKHRIGVDERLARELWAEYGRQRREAAQEGLL